MRKNYIITLSTLCFLFIYFSAYSVNKGPKKNTEIKSKQVSAKEAKLISKLEKKIKRKLQRKDADLEVDFEDPVNKWMWFWIFGWGIGWLTILLGAFSGLALIPLLGGLIIMFGTASLVIWLIKKFA